MILAATILVPVPGAMYTITAEDIGNKWSLTWAHSVGHQVPESQSYQKKAEQICLHPQQPEIDAIVATAFPPEASPRISQSTAEWTETR